jgi:hypothetical protein
MYRSGVLLLCGEGADEKTIIRYGAGQNREVN